MFVPPWNATLARTLAPMFATDCPIPIRLWAVLDGTISGRIVVDRIQQPTVALVQELTEGTTYIGGTPTPQHLRDGITLLRSTHTVVVCCWPDDALVAMLPDTPSYTGTAIDFTDRSRAVNLDVLGSVPTGYQLQRIDTEIISALSGFDYYETMFGSVERALTYTIGYCLLHDDMVVSEAVAGPLTRGIAEIGIGTVEAYRQRGFGTITAATVIQECETRGYQAFWNAAQHNLASVALARRLGFQSEQPFRVVAWDAP